jgi:hypothetical protein
MMTERKQPRKPKKFRSQIVAKWLAENFPKLKAAEGLLAYLLNQEGWQATVIDPEYQELPTKYKDPFTKKRVKISREEKVERITSPFEEELGKDFDLLIGLHSHGSNIKIINAAKKYNKDFFLIPCCVIDEPITKMPDINWRESLIEYATSLGLTVKEVKLGFMGKDTALYTNSYD